MRWEHQQVLHMKCTETVGYDQKDTVQPPAWNCTAVILCRCNEIINGTVAMGRLIRELPFRVNKLDCWQSPNSSGPQVTTFRLQLRLGTMQSPCRSSSEDGRKDCSGAGLKNALCCPGSEVTRNQDLYRSTFTVHPTHVKYVAAIIRAALHHQH